MSVLALVEGFDPGSPFGIIVLGLGLVVFVAIAALSRQNERPYSASVVYLVLGLLGGALLLPALDQDPLDPFGEGLFVEHLTELALVVAVFASGLSVAGLPSRRSGVQVALLLGIVLPATVALIALFGTQVMGLSLGAAVLLGAILAPTDPVLAGDVGLAGPETESEAEEPRFSLHAEAGINDGLASPFVLLGVFIVEEDGTGWLGEWLGVDLLVATGGAVLLGALGGRGVAAATRRLRRSGFLKRDFDGFVGLATALAVYGAAEAIDVYGLVAVFAAGVAFRRFESEHGFDATVHEGAHTAGRALELAVLLVLGSFVTGDGLSAPGVAGWLLAPLLIFVVRPALVLPFADRVVQTSRERAFLAFFGVRGVAALFYATYVVSEDILPAEEARVVFWTAAVTVMVSIVVHGVSATPLTRRLLTVEDRR